MKPIRMILLADDDVDDRELFHDAVHQVERTLDVDFATNGSELLQRLEQTIPDLLFLDINMYPIDGIEALGLIRREDRFSSLPIIMFSSSHNPEDIDAARSLGANLFIHKPDSYDALRNCIRKALNLDWDSPRDVTSNYFRGDQSFC